ncbi:DNA-directed RNA polymerase subunit alpha C-terminal domain-containing protein [Paenibacillus camerounensis]|uniref:DNA-directed RNA polymerase subunit alpha C-terminal domain-containing protein n=1 Tax=Paenibacillus camerounensis TaxID=1243663 RepID=UPI0012F7AE6E
MTKVVILSTADWIRIKISGSNARIAKNYCKTVSIIYNIYQMNEGRQHVSLSARDTLPLMSYFNIDRNLYAQPIHSLRQGTTRNPKSISRILNSLHDSNYVTIGDLMKASLTELLCLRNFGVTGQTIVIELLEAHVKSTV